MSRNNNVDNSISISGGNVSGSQFATNSTNFAGTINNITDTQQMHLERLTDSLIQALHSESELITEADVTEITDAIEQAKEATLKESVNKLSLKGVLSGIDMVMETLKGISSSTRQLYTDWQDEITILLNSL